MNVISSEHRAFFVISTGESEALPLFVISTEESEALPLFVISTEESEANEAEKSCHFDRSGAEWRNFFGFLDCARNDKEENTRNDKEKAFGMTRKKTLGMTRKKRSE